MRTAFVLLTCLLFTSSTRADATSDAQAIIERAIRMQAGSVDKLEALRSWTQSMNGQLYAPNGEIMATKEIQLQGTDQFRGVFNLTVGQRMIRTTIGIDGEKGWCVFPTGQVEDLTLSQINDFRDEMYVMSLTTLVPLKSKGLTFESLADTKINGVEVTGFKVSQTDRPTVSIYFDKKTGLLLKTSFPGKEAGVRVTKESVFTDYKEFAGIMLPTKIMEHHNNNKAGNWTITNYSFGGKIDAKVFAKP